MESMTGYAFIEKSTEQFSYAVELKSLNSRYLETNVNLPRVLRNEENDFNTVLKNCFSRGKLELNIEIFEWVSKRKISLNRETIVTYYNELKKVHDSLGIKDELKFESVLSLDGVLQKMPSQITDKSLKQIYSSMNHVIKKTIEMKKKEGVSIKKDILNSLSFISRETAKIKKKTGIITKEKTIKLKKRISALAGNGIDENRLYSEIAILADKLDINEEIVRLNDHIKKFKSSIASGSQIGRKLDFLAQEIFREINTIGAKSNSSNISHYVVEIKNHIDKIREHCRNIV